MIRRARAAAWKRLLIGGKLDPRFAGEWARHARSNIQLIPIGSRDEDKLKRGRSKLGGEPDFPVGMDWPIRPGYELPRAQGSLEPETTWQEYALRFVAQINLADIARVGCDLPLPKSGLLLFFYDADHMPAGIYPQEAVGWRVIYVSEKVATERRSDPSGRPSWVRPIRLKPSESLPSCDWIEDQLRGDARFSAEMVSNELDKLIEDRKLAGRLSYGGHAFGGWPTPVQYPMEFDCEMVSRGVGPDDSVSQRRRSGFRKRASDWRLLLQLYSDPDLAWAWGDLGMIYFMCREQDIADKRFDRVWLIMQFH